MALDIPDINPADLKFEFNREWETFRRSKSFTFLALWAKKKRDDLKTKLENVTPDELVEVQGRLRAVNETLGLLAKPFIQDDVKEVLAHHTKK